MEKCDTFATKTTHLVQSHSGTRDAALNFDTKKITHTSIRFQFSQHSSTQMSNHPENLDIYDSTGPPAGILATSAADPDEPSTMISVMQDISTFGIAGRIWDR